MLITALLLNETLLSAAKHQPSIVSDADLFCETYTKVQNLSSKDTIFLGASRMQTGLDLDTVYERYPHSKALLLAQSGKGSSYPVFKDIVDRTDYKGTIAIDETELTLADPGHEQLSFVKHCYDNFSVNRQLNRQISTWLQSHLIFLNPQSSSFRLWGNLLSERQLPAPFYTTTLGDRQQLVDYARAQPQALKQLHDSKLNIDESHRQPLLTFAAWFDRAKHWQSAIEKFQQRGGKAIFIRMPVAEDRWELEGKVYPPDRYWQPWIKQFNLKSIHFADYADLRTFKLLDTSHLDMHDKKAFTQLLLTHIQAELN